MRRRSGLHRKTARAILGAVSSPQRTSHVGSLCPSAWRALDAPGRCSHIAGMTPVFHGPLRIEFASWCVSPRLTKGLDPFCGRARSSSSWRVAAQNCQQRGSGRGVADCGSRKRRHRTLRGSRAARFPGRRPLIEKWAKTSLVDSAVREEQTPDRERDPGCRSPWGHRP